MSTYSNAESGGEDGGGCSCECTDAGGGPTPVRFTDTALCTDAIAWHHSVELSELWAEGY